MEFIKKFFSSKGVGYYLTLPALICGIIAVISYTNTGVTKFSPELYSGVLVFGWIGVALMAGSLIYQFKPVKYVAYLLVLFAFITFIESQATYIANIFVSIDGTTFTSGFISTAVFFVVTIVVALFAAILSDWQPWAKKAAPTAKQTDTTSEGGEE